MTTSSYLKVQTELLIIRETIRHLPIKEFEEKVTEAIEKGYIVDERGIAVATNPQLMMKIVKIAKSIQRLEITE